MDGLNIEGILKRIGIKLQAWRTAVIAALISI